MLRVDIQAQVDDFTLAPALESDDELVVLFGPSGCGKSLTLRTVAGLLTPARGRIELPGGTVAFDSESKVNLPPQMRNVGYVVQDLALFPHMSVRQNIDFAIARLPKQRREERASTLITMLGLEGLQDRRPRQLSGGQQQRVALARALVAEPSLLLLDEPFSALDAPLRTMLRRELASLRRRLGLTAVFVTHDLAEAHALADRIVVMDDGRVLQQGPKDEVLRRPASRRVAELTDVRNIIPGTIIAYVEGVAVVQTPWFTARVRDPQAPVHGDVYLCIRPEHVLMLRTGRQPRDPGDAVIDATIVEDIPLGNTHRLFLRATPHDAPTGEPLLIEVDVPAHPYDVLGVPTRSDWQLVLMAEHTSLVPRD